MIGSTGALYFMEKDKIKELEQEIERLNNIIKEVREEVEKLANLYDDNYTITDKAKDILETLDKEKDNGKR